MIKKSVAASDKDRRKRAFDKNMVHISKIILSVGSFYFGTATHTVRLDDRLHFYVEHDRIDMPTNFEIPPDYPMTKKQFLEEFAALCVGEWDREYSSSDEIKDGTEWTLTVEYSNGRRPFRSEGMNAYPPHFRELLALFNLDKEA